MTSEAVLALLGMGLFGIATASAVVGALVALPPRGWQHLPWPERARLLQPIRIAPFLSTIVLSVVLSWVDIIYLSIFGFRPTLGLLIGVHLTALLGAIAVGMFCAWKFVPRRPGFSDWLAGCLSAMLFSYPNALVYMVTAIALYVLAHDLSTVLGLLILGAGGMAFAAWGGGILVARALSLARPALPRAAHAADWAAERVGIRANAVFELQWSRVRVDAFVFSRYLVVTDAAAELLSDEELLALSIRELTFFQQPWLAGGLRIVDSAVIFLMLASVAIGATISRHALLVGTLLVYAVAFLIRLPVRRAQLKADALAAKSAIDPTAALKALERQYELNLTPVVALSNRSRDAHLYDRMVAAGIPPAYPRPEPPSKGKIFLSVAASVGACLVLSAIFLMVVSILFGN